VLCGIKQSKLALELDGLAQMQTILARIEFSHCDDRAKFCGIIERLHNIQGPFLEEMLEETINVYNTSKEFAHPLQDTKTALAALEHTTLQVSHYIRKLDRLERQEVD